MQYSARRTLGLTIDKDKHLRPCDYVEANYHDARTARFKPVDPTQPNKLFVAIVSVIQHKRVKFTTLARWIKDLISVSGDDSTDFKAHSIYHYTLYQLHGSFNI